MASQRDEDKAHFVDEETEAQAVCDPDLYLEASGDIIGKAGMHASLAPDPATC